MATISSGGNYTDNTSFIYETNVHN